jgi:hypothetical protein
MRVVTIKIRGRGVETDAPSAEDLLEQVRDYLEILKGVEVAIAEDGQNAIDWRVVNASKSSPLQIELGSFSRQYAVNIDRRSHAVVHRTSEGLSRLRDGTERPPFFTDRVLSRVRRVFERVTNGLDLSEVNFGSDLPPFVVTPQVAVRAANNVKIALNPIDKPYRELGSIDGITEGVERDGHGRRILNLRHRLTGDTVKCVLSGNALQEIQDHHIAEVYRGRRLRVFGIIHYRGLGRISEVEVTEAEFGKPKTELPTIDDILDENFTGGLRSEEYLDRLRDGELP